MENVQAAEVCLPSQDLAADLAFYTRELGFWLGMIFPADDPGVAVLSGHGLRLRLQLVEVSLPADFGTRVYRDER